MSCVLPEPSSPIGRCEVIVAEATPGTVRRSSRRADWKARPRSGEYPERDKEIDVCRKAVGAIKAGGAVHDVEGRACEQSTADQDDEADTKLEAEQAAAAKAAA